MDVRTSSQVVVFPRPFSVTGIDAQQPAGTYTIEIEEERIEALSFLAYRRVSTRIRLVGDATRPGLVETVVIDPAEIDAALVPQ